MMNYTPRGWIKLSRDIVNQEIFKVAESLRLYIYLICLAASEPTTFRNVEIARGQVAMSYRTLASELQLPVRRVRTLIDKLTSAHYLAHYQSYSGAHSFSIITVCDYDKYNGYSKASRHNKRPIVGHNTGQHSPLYSLYNEKEVSTKVDIKEDKEGKISSSPDFEKLLIEKLTADEAWRSKVAEAFILDEATLSKKLDEFFISNECRGKYHASLSDLKSHFINYLQIVQNFKHIKIKYYENNETGRCDKRRGIDAGFHSAEEFEGPF